jgi:hypothetical protein
LAALRSCFVGSARAQSIRRDGGTHKQAESMQTRAELCALIGPSRLRGSRCLDRRNGRSEGNAAALVADVAVGSRIMQICNPRNTEAAD